MSKESNGDIMGSIGRALLEHHKASATRITRGFTPALRDCSLVATADTTEGTVLFSTPFPMVNWRGICVILVNNEPPGVHLYDSEDLQKQCAKAIAMDTLNSYSKILAYADEQEDSNATSTSEQ